MATNRFRQVTDELCLALSVGLVGGFVLGSREALLTLEANAFVEPDRYLLPYIAVPILTCMGLGAALVLPLGLARAILRRKEGTTVSLSLYAGALGFAGGLSIAVPWFASIAARLQQVGETVSLPVSALLWTLVIIFAGGVAKLLGAAAWYGARAWRPLRRAVSATLLLSLLLMWPVAAFFATDWKWDRPERSRAGQAPSGPNVLLISIDTLRADHLGTYGSADRLTPHLDALAAEGVTFRQAITSSPWTLPAMASVLSGAYPHRHGAGQIINHRDPLGRSAIRPESWTLTKALHDRGYRTQAIVTNPYLALRYGLGEGFDGYENLTVESEIFLAARETTALRLLEWLRPDLIIGDRGEAVSDRAATWLERAPSDRPFFLWLHYVDPHPPYNRAGVTRHKSFREDSLLAPRTHRDDVSLSSPDVARLRSGEIRLSSEEKDAVRALYRAEVASVDRAVAIVLDALDRRGLRDRTLVIVVGDHGEEFWEHGGVEHGHTVYEELVRVPLLMRWPGHLPEGAVSEPLVRTVDIAPTVLDLLGLPIPAADGATLLPVLHGDKPQPLVAVIENLLFAEERVGIRTIDQEYVRWENGKEEVYDLARDPHELHDLAGLASYARPLRQLYARVERDTSASSLITAEPSLGRRREAALRAFGYVQ